MMRQLVFSLALGLAAMAAAPDTPTTTATPAKKTPTKKTATKKKAVVRKPPVVAVSPAVRRAALEAVSARTSAPAGSIEGSGALVPFFEQVSRPAASGPVRILQYGDSHTASDDWADEMRQDFQRKFGAGGRASRFRAVLFSDIAASIAAATTPRAGTRTVW